MSTRRIWLLVVLFALVTTTGSVAAWQVAGPVPSRAAIALIAQPEEDEGGAVCPPGEADCEVTDEDETGGGGDGDGDGTGDSNTGGGGGACTYTVSTVVAASLAAAQTRTFEVPCYRSDAGWYDGEGCYYGDFPDIRDATGGIPDPPEGKTEEDGRYYYLQCIANVQIFGDILNFTLQAVERWVWVDFEDVPTITPEQVFLDWYADITLDPVQPRLAPPAGTSGLVGLPVWLGLEPTPNSLGSIDEDHCIDGVCVTIAGEVTTVEWTMGDGGSVSCAPGEHVVWERGDDFLVPRGCHHYYHQASRDQAGGQYEITATSHWEVTWTADASNAGGSEFPERTATVSLQIDEIQVLTGR
ncbi:MAG: hypothetical protein GEV12_05960 [Micromonosporaceae bacterium]|nr:hypothetical protein [Micromonosporaceae bacterium]